MALNSRRRDVLAFMLTAPFLPKLYSQRLKYPDCVATLERLTDKLNIVNPHRIGAIYLSAARQANTWETEKDALVHLLQGVYLPMADDYALSKIESAISSEFSAGNTLAIDGWFMAKTECRLCALIASLDLQARGTR